MYQFVKNVVFCRHQSNTSKAADELVDMLGNYLDLKPFSDSPHGTPTVLGEDGGAPPHFYAEHFPLLLRKKGFMDEEAKEMEESKVVSEMIN